MLSPLYSNDTMGQNNNYQMANYQQLQREERCLDILGTLQGISIQQRFEFILVMTGFQSPNVFRVFPINDQWQQLSQKELFKCKELSSNFARASFSPHYRPFEMLVYDCRFKDQDILFQSSSDQIVFKFVRKYRCTFWCLNRPRLDIFYREKGYNQNLGYIINPFVCCKLSCHIFDSQDQLKYIIDAPGCQCDELTFNIKTSNGEVVAFMKKKFRQSQSELIDNFSVVFPQNASKIEKALLLAATIMFEYMYFERRHGPQGID
ncbi:unnamed protein product [Paramecium primaurelia]|uniref:Phospholipid scramblase n=1 Tax=Paramecium primaurelia TaxID=5886 RepID=A0A8S1QG15_PARPR|nr:unnamed protein product [Paramecium primaurelia]